MKMGLGSFILLLFITLKLCHVINWSWWWVFSPLWITIAIGLFIIIAVVYFGAKLD